jgi:hypothetical protein
MMVHARFVPNPPKRVCLPTVAPWKCGDTHPFYSSLLNPYRKISPFTARSNKALADELAAPPPKSQHAATKSAQ